MVVGRSTGGIGLHAVDLATHLRALGDDVVFVTDDLTADRFELTGALRWWPTRSGGLRGAARSLRRLHRLARTCDVVHAHGHQAGLLAVLAAMGTSTPVVVSQHNAVLGGAGVRALPSRVVQAVVARRAALVTGASSDLVEVATAHGARGARLAAVPSPRVPGLVTNPLLDAGERAAAAEALLAARGIPATATPNCSPSCGNGSVPPVRPCTSWVPWRTPRRGCGPPRSSCCPAGGRRGPWSCRRPWPPGCPWSRATPGACTTSWREPACSSGSGTRPGSPPPSTRSCPTAHGVNSSPSRGGSAPQRGTTAARRHAGGESGTQRCPA